MEFKKVSEGTWEIPKEGGMLVPGRVYGTEKIVERIESGAINQIKNVAYLPGIQKYSIALPDAHIGYGFPIGGVAGIDYEKGVVSPGGIGFDINCGVRLIKTNLELKEVKPKVREIIEKLFVDVPSGLGSKGQFRANKNQLNEVMQEGAKWAVKEGFGWSKDLEHMEENGRIELANREKVSEKAIQRGMPQLGSLGSGNHFLEIQLVEQLFDERVAEKFGLSKGQIVLMVHTGSRGFGHQIASDYLGVMKNAMNKYGIRVPDPQLCCAPINSKEGKDYLEAMYCAVNFAFANRQMIMHWVRDGFSKIMGRSAEEMNLELLYDVAHNIAKIEEHNVEGKRKKLLVHRKGATRAFPAGRKENPKAYAESGHPAIIPGSMGTASWIVVGTEKGLEETFGSIAHGAGRVMSRHEAMRRKKGKQVQEDLMKEGKLVKAASYATLAEEMPEAYKDVDEVVKSLEVSGIAKKIARVVPLGVVKG
ncbi:MAG: RtcB family protein [archaeon]|nr:RtcB family protein [Candidatus Micrarchaeota archaeon]